jgi:hypothetical protein
MFQNLSEILKSFSVKQRLTVLLLLLITILASIFIKSYFSTTDLAPMQKQLNECVASQGTLINQNSLLVSKTKDLTDGYLKIDSVLKNIKPDTVFVVKTETIAEHPVAEARRVMYSEDRMMASAPPPPGDTHEVTHSELPKPIIKTIKKGNSAEVLKDVRIMIQEKTKK